MGAKFDKFEHKEEKIMCLMATNQEEQNYKRMFKIGVFGSRGVGKSTLIHQYVNLKFDENIRPTMDFEFHDKITENEQKFKLQIWDMGGCLELSKSFFRGLDAIILVFDVHNAKSFNQLMSIIDYIVDDRPELPMFLVANKIDRNEETNLKCEAVKLAKTIGIPYFEVSGKSGQNVNILFHKVASECYQLNRAKNHVLDK